MNIVIQVGIYLIIIATYFLFKKSPSQSVRDNWLLSHFGKEGMKKWLITMELSGQYKDLDAWYIRWNCLGQPKNGYTYRKYAKALRAVDRSKAKHGDKCFDAPYRNSSGKVSGLVMNGSWDYFWLNQNPPWDNSYYQPRGADWIAAGYVEGFTLSNGVYIDPVAMYLSKSEGGRII